MGTPPSHASDFTDLRTAVQIRNSQLNPVHQRPQWQLLPTKYLTIESREDVSWSTFNKVVWGKGEARKLLSNSLRDFIWNLRAVTLIVC